jgi:hypothetical protein
MRLKEVVVCLKAAPIVLINKPREILMCRGKAETLSKCSALSSRLSPPHLEQAALIGAQAIKNRIVLQLRSLKDMQHLR